MNVKPSSAGKIVEMRRAGMSAREVAAQLRVDESWVYKCSRAAGIVRVKGKRKQTPDPVVDAVRARARVKSEVAEGKRCRVCWLLLPCADHQP